MTNPLEYVPAPVPQDCELRISPSQFASFIQSPHKWYRSEILKEDPFGYTTSTVLGTVVHYCAEKVAKKEFVDVNDIQEYIKSKEPYDDYDPAVVQHQYQGMAETLVNDYVQQNTFDLIEFPCYAMIKPGFYAAGTLDAGQGNKDDMMIVDYKSYASKTKPKTIPAHYKYQLLVYAWILIQNGYNVNRIRLVYINRHIEGEISPKTGKQFKSYPPEVTVLTESIEEGDIDFIEGLLELCVDTVIATGEHPELTHVLWHDPRLKV